MNYSQKLEGAKLIQDFLMEELVKKELVVSSFEWQPIIETMADEHNLVVHTKEATHMLKNIPRESIEDYPGKVGSEKINLFMKEWVKNIKA